MDAKESTPGGRHGNDHMDFRAIRNEPTVQEINCSAPPYLPLSSAEYPLLERHYRLLREDMLQPVREDLKKKGHEKRVTMFQHGRWEGASVCFILYIFIR